MAFAVHAAGESARLAARAPVDVIPGTQYDRAATVGPYISSWVSIVMILLVIMWASAFASIAAHRDGMPPRALIGWIVIVMVGGPIGVALWFRIGARHRAAD